MKKYVLLVFIGIFLPVGFSFGFGACDGGTEEACCMEDPDMCCTLYPDNPICTQANGGDGGGNCVILTLTNGSTLDYCGPSQCQSQYQAFGNNPQNTSLQEAYTNCISEYGPDNSGGTGVGGTGASACTGGSIINGQCVVNNPGNMGIEMNPDCLINGQCKFDIYQTLGIRQSLPRETRSSPGIFIQDIILSATFFVGTLITAVLIISGLLYVFAGVNAGLADKAKKGITGSLIGLLFVVGSYAFVRLIQFLVTGGGG